MKMIAVKYAVNTDLVVEIIPAESYEEAYHILMYLSIEKCTTHPVEKCTSYFSNNFLVSLIL